jgi:hypothetical protein
VSVPTRPSHVRQDPPEIAALRRVKAAQPELGAAVDMQIDLVTLQRRLHQRLSTPWIAVDLEEIAGRLHAGTPVLRFADIGFDWTEVRLLFRQIADVLLRYDTLESGDHGSLMSLVRASHPDAHDVEPWYTARAGRQSGLADVASPHGDAFAQVLELATRPFIERAGDALRARIDLSGWRFSHCPLCGSDPEMASVGHDGARRLHCGGCGTGWATERDTCPYCQASHPGDFVEWASADRCYRLTACTRCRRYTKALDVRRSDRPLMLSVDTIATLPLDAAAMSRGFTA